MRECARARTYVSGSCKVRLEMRSDQTREREREGARAHARTYVSGSCKVRLEMRSDQTLHDTICVTFHLK